MSSLARVRPVILFLVGIGMCMLLLAGCSFPETNDTFQSLGVVVEKPTITGGTGVGVSGRSTSVTTFTVTEYVIYADGSWYVEPGKEIGVWKTKGRVMLFGLIPILPSSSLWLGTPDGTHFCEWRWCKETRR
jgi:hypothetical protein